VRSSRDEVTPAAAGADRAVASAPAPVPESSDGSWAIALLSSLLVGIVVAATAGGLSLVRPASALSPGAAVGVRAAGGVALLVGAALLWRRPWTRERVGPGAASARVAAMRTAVAISGVVTVVALVANPIDVERAGPGPAPSPGVPDFGAGLDDGEGIRGRAIGGSSIIRGRELEPAGSTGEAVRLDDEVVGTPVADRMRRMLGPLLALAVALVLIRRLARPPSEHDEGQPVESPATEGVAGRFAEPSVGPTGPFSDDPRGRIAAAYHRLLIGLASVGLGRRPEEGPHEHVQRATASDPTGAVLHQVTGLYVLAEFGAAALSERHGRAAERALSEALRWVDGRGATDG